MSPVEIVHHPRDRVGLAQDNGPSSQAAGRVLIIGAGPAGLTAGYVLAKAGIAPLICERSDLLGGISKTETYRGYHFDMGGHRYYTKIPEIRQIWREVLGSDLLLRNRLSRIYYRGKFFDYPLHPLKAALTLGSLETLRVILSFLYRSVRPHPTERNFAQWVTNRFGDRLFDIFFKTYTEKVWGIPTEALSADWAAQRIRNLSLWKVVAAAIFPQANLPSSLIEQFHYPRRGPGMMWNTIAKHITSLGGRIATNTELVQLHCDDNRIRAATLATASQTLTISVEHVISTAPLPDLMTAIKPRPPEHVRKAARRLRYRDFLMVGLIIEEADLFPDNWIYVHDPQVKVGRIQNFKNWSPDMVPDARCTSLGLEYFCTVGDSLWAMSDAQLIELAVSELAALGLCKEERVRDGRVFRVARAYPLYDERYREFVDLIRTYIQGLDNLQSIGRNGQHRYDNQDHAMLAGRYAALNVSDNGSRDTWSINTEQAYLEDERLLPQGLLSRGRNPMRAMTNPATAQSV